MAKKVRRVKKKRRTKKQSAATRENIEKTTPAAETSTEPQLSSTEQFRQEYAYVVKDLRRVLILAVIMFALLIALNLLLQ